jgi:hypothetical protein
VALVTIVSSTPLLVFINAIEYEGFRKRTEYHQEHSRHRCLYFTLGKQWSKDLLSNKGISISQHTSKARARGEGNDRN